MYLYANSSLRAEVYAKALLSFSQYKKEQNVPRIYYKQVHHLTPLR